ncbi:MAG: AbrB/MazE/SpoVT family DNA-binding domain-containing protein [Candidatus Omnitrophota bacterium]|nr:AbrB/MazE/SpoVT family DNA-binding domain-containing protein [Candidatus Omnitrophota bacterium]
MSKLFKLRQVNQKNQITLPNEICKKLGIHGGDYVKIQIVGNASVIVPISISEKDFSATEVKAMNADITRQLKSGENTQCKDLSVAKKHLKRLKK